MGPARRARIALWGGKRFLYLAAMSRALLEVVE